MRPSFRYQLFLILFSSFSVRIASFTERSVFFVSFFSSSALCKCVALCTFQFNWRLTFYVRRFVCIFLRRFQMRAKRVAWMRAILHTWRTVDAAIKPVIVRLMCGRIFVWPYILARSSDLVAIPLMRAYMLFCSVYEQRIMSVCTYKVKMYWFLCSLRSFVHHREIRSLSSIYNGT